MSMNKNVISAIPRLRDVINALLIRYVRCAIKTILRFRISALAVILFQIVFPALS